MEQQQETAKNAEKERKKEKMNYYRKRGEDTEQENVISWANWHLREYPELKWLHHIPNGGERNKA